METNPLIVIIYRCRDNGYGDIEEGSLTGRWTGEVDTWGKRTFQPIDGTGPYYFFDDEIVDEFHEPVGLVPA